MIRILIAEDSMVVAKLLAAILDQQPDMRVVAIARDGREAVRLAHELKPDLVTMDIRMPEMDGFEATRMIMSTNPLPIVVISSSVNSDELRITFRAIEEGALAVIEKPPGPTHPDHEHLWSELVEMVRAMASVKVVRRWQNRSAPDVDLFEAPAALRNRRCEIVAMACSTGGPQVLQCVLSSLPIAFPTPIIIVQHIAHGFIDGLVSWLRGSTLLHVKLAEDGDVLRAGCVYLAPDDRHLRIERRASELAVCLDASAPVNGFRPSATPLFESVADVCAGRAVGAVFTGMGVDGAQGLLAMRRAGCHTFVQDEQSSVVYGMPGSALAIEAVDQVVRLDRIPAYLLSLVRQRSAADSGV